MAFKTDIAWNILKNLALEYYIYDNNYILRLNSSGNIINLINPLLKLDNNLNSESKIVKFRKERAH